MGRLRDYQDVPSRHIVCGWADGGYVVAGLLFLIVVENFAGLPDGVEKVLVSAGGGDLLKWIAARVCWPGWQLHQKFRLVGVVGHGHVLVGVVHPLSDLFHVSGALDWIARVQCLGEHVVVLFCARGIKLFDSVVSFLDFHVRVKLLVIPCGHGTVLFEVEAPPVLELENGGRRGVRAVHNIRKLKPEPSCHHAAVAASSHDH